MHDKLLLYIFWQLYQNLGLVGAKIRQKMGGALHKVQGKGMFGLKNNEINEIKTVLKTNGANTALLFGSRATGNHKRGSDIEIAVDTNETKISYILNEESSMPYFFDIVNISKIKEPLANCQK
jgi:uncharacterized protein